MRTRTPWFVMAMALLLAAGCGETVEVGGDPQPDPGPGVMEPDPGPTPTPDPMPDMVQPDPEPDGVCGPDLGVFEDSDGDGFGTGDLQCVPGVEPGEGFATEDGDCGPADPLRSPGAQEICGDFVDDDCDGDDAACPTSQPSVVVPDWDCTGDAPANVYASARFPDGGGFFKNNGCFVFFEGVPGEFYVARKVERANEDPNCEGRNGCTCPSLNGWPSYDRRMYAFTLSGAPEDCAEISIRDHGGEDQPVSNACRKYLYQMHAYDIPFSYVGAGLDTLQQRLELFSTVEIACVEDAPHANLPYQTLVTTEIELNPGYVAQ